MPKTEAKNSHKWSPWLTCSFFINNDDSQKTSEVPKMRIDVSENADIKPTANTVLLTGNMIPQ